jgi:hypothetical protein
MRSLNISSLSAVILIAMTWLMGNDIRAVLTGKSAAYSHRLRAKQATTALLQPLPQRNIERSSYQNLLPHNARTGLFEQRRSAASSAAAA